LQSNKNGGAPKTRLSSEGKYVHTSDPVQSFIILPFPPSPFPCNTKGEGEEFFSKGEKGALTRPLNTEPLQSRIPTGRNLFTFVKLAGSWNIFARRHGIIYIIYNVKHELQAISGNSKIVSNSNCTPLNILKASS
jgi:hypothetical protein